MKLLNAKELVEGNNLFDDFFLKEELSPEQIRKEIITTIKAAQRNAIEYTLLAATNEVNLIQSENDSPEPNWIDVDSILDLWSQIYKENNLDDTKPA